MAAATSPRRLHQIEQTARLIAALLVGRKLTRQQAADLLGVEVAAADRQLKGIERHLPLIRERQGGHRVVSLNRHRLLSGWKTVPAGTWIAACLGSGLSTLFAGTSYAIGMDDMLRSVAERTGRRDDLENIRRQFVFIAGGGEKALPEGQESLDTLIDGIRKSHVVRFDYVSADGRKRRETIEPYSLAVYQHQLYVLGRTSEGSLHPFRFARIAKPTLLPRRFSYPDKDAFDPARMFQDSFGVFVDDAKYPVERVIIRFNKRLRQLVRTHRWHASQEVIGTKGDEVTLCLRVRTCPELVAWILGLGGDAVVVQPSSLRRRIQEKLAALSAAYGARTDD